MAILQTLSMQDEAILQIIQQTKQWIQQVVIGCGFCPFANKVVLDNSIYYKVVEGTALHTHSSIVLEELKRLDTNPEIETSLIIFPDAYEHFSAYLNLLKQTEKQSARKGYEGIYQIASFHPLYVFAGAAEDDAANFTNRSPYPMLHLLREASVSKAVAFYPDAEGIPERNIQFAQQKGLDYMQELWKKSKQYP